MFKKVPALVAAVVGLALVIGVGTAQAAPVSKVVYSTPAQVAKVNQLLKAKASQSTTTLTVGYGCDQVALYVSLVDPQISAFMNTSGGFGGDFDRTALRRAPTWLRCDLDMRTVNHYPVFAATSSVEVAGTDSHITGWQITSRGVR